jgi:hypothetical protein
MRLRIPLSATNLVAPRQVSVSKLTLASVTELITLAKQCEGLWIHGVLDNVRMHKGKQVQAWLAKHPRFVFSFPPVHCSWMNQVEQWFSILQRKRLRIADFADKKHLTQRLMAFVVEWNEHAHPFQWSTKSVAKVMAKCENPMANAA